MMALLLAFLLPVAAYAAPVDLLNSSGGSGGAPSGAAGGDLTGTYPNPTLATLQPNATNFSNAAGVSINNGLTVGALGVGAPSALTQAVFGSGITVYSSGTFQAQALRVLASSGTSGQVLTSDTQGNASWQAASGGGSQSATFASSVTINNNNTNATALSINLGAHAGGETITSTAADGILLALNTADSNFQIGHEYGGGGNYFTGALGDSGFLYSNGYPIQIASLAGGPASLTSLGNGNIGIQTTAPLSEFDVRSTTGPSQYVLTVSSQNATRMLTVTGNGHVAAVGELDQGLVLSCTLGLITTSTGAITGCAASDRRLKTDIKPLSYSGSRIDLLRPVTYHWKDPERGIGERQGFIAQDVESVYPDAVVPAGKNLKGVDYNALIAELVLEVQHLRKRVSALEHPGAK